MKRYMLFVYNANAGYWNGVMDSLHKVFSPKSYPCSLCGITYGLRKINPDWDEFIKTELEAAKPVFLHKDEWQEAFGIEVLEKYALPAIFWVDKKNNELEMLILKEEMDRLSLDQLKERLKLVMADAQNQQD